MVCPASPTWGGKEPLAEALPLVNGRPSWKPYQTSPAPVEGVLSWSADYGSDMSGTGLNIGLVTGCAGLYVLDFDTPSLPRDPLECTRSAADSSLRGPPRSLLTDSRTDTSV